MFRGSIDSDEPLVLPAHHPSHRLVPVREVKFRSRFAEIPRYETLLKYIPCIWRKEVGRSLRGGLYLSENHIAFYCASKTAKETEMQRKLLMEIMTVVGVTKERSLNIFPDSIGIETVAGEKYIFAQLFSRNTVYKSLCDLCGIIPSANSRRGSVEPGAFSGGDPAFGDAEDDCDLIFQRDSEASSKEHSTSSSSSLSSSSTPPDLKRTLSVVCETSQDDVVEAQSHRLVLANTPGVVSRSNSGRELGKQLEDPAHDQEETAAGRHLIFLLRLIIGLLLLTAVISVYQIYTRPLSTRNRIGSFDQSLGDVRLASEVVIQVAEQARTFLNSFIDPKLHSGN